MVMMEEQEVARLGEGRKGKRSELLAHKIICSQVADVVYYGVEVLHDFFVIGVDKRDSTTE